MYSLPCGSEYLVFPVAILHVKIKMYKTIFFPVDLHGCESWFLASGKEHRLNVVENRVQRKIFDHRKDEVVGGWRTFQSEDVHKFYSSAGSIR